MFLFVRFRIKFNFIVQASQISQSTVLGASGAIYGLLTAFAFMFPNAQLGLMFIPIPIKAKYFVTSPVSTIPNGDRFYSNSLT